MAKPRALQISIPTSCKQGWDNMTDAGSGRHCDSCNKTVIDFTTYTDKELADFFLKAKGNICGHVNMHQLNKAILIHETKKRSLFHKIFFGTALASWLGFATSALAQNAPITYTQKPEYRVGDISITDPSGYTLKPIEAKILPPKPNNYYDDPNYRLNIRADRAEATEYIIDGMMIVTNRDEIFYGTPTDTIEELLEITGGIPARFDGDWDDIGGNYITPDPIPLKPIIK